MSKDLQPYIAPTVRCERLRQLYEEDSSAVKNIPRQKADSAIEMHLNGYTYRNIQKTLCISCDALRNLLCMYHKGLTLQESKNLKAGKMKFKEFTKKDKLSGAMSEPVHGSPISNEIEMGKRVLGEIVRKGATVITGRLQTHIEKRANELMAEKMGSLAESLVTGITIEQIADMPIKDRVSSAAKLMAEVGKIRKGIDEKTDSLSKLMDAINQINADGAEVIEVVRGADDE